MQFGHERCHHIAELDVCHRGALIRRVTLPNV